MRRKNLFWVEKDTDAFHIVHYHGEEIHVECKDQLEAVVKAILEKEWV